MHAAISNHGLNIFLRILIVCGSKTLLAIIAIKLIIQEGSWRYKWNYYTKPAWFEDWVY